MNANATWADVVSVGLNVLQTCFLAWMAARSTMRRGDVNRES